MSASANLEALLATASRIHLDGFATLFDEERSLPERVAAVEDLLRASGRERVVTDSDSSRW